MNKKKIIASSILSLAMCASVVTGATFALFTSESETNVAINSGKVEVKATLQNLELYSPTLIAADGSAIIDGANAAQDGKFATGGTAELESPELTLTNMVPGDYATFQIQITNYSTVATQYRTILKVVDDNGLASGLEMGIKKASETDYASYAGDVVYSNWAPLSIPVGESEVVELNDCKIELPIEALNEYQNKSCKVVCVVEAIQANASTDNNVAKIGENAYETLEEAIENVQSDETIEIIRPGTYAPFTIPVGKTNVTVKGIVGASKAESTVIRTTATDNVRTYGDGTTLDSLWIESPVAMSCFFTTAGSVSPYYNTGAGDIAKDITINNCHLDGHNVEGFAILYCSSGLTFTNNTVENYGVGVYVMSDGSYANGFAVTDNTFINVKEPVNAYWGNTVATDVDVAPVVITGNVVKGDDMSYITLWDLSQMQHGTTAFADIQVSGNNGNIVYNLTHFDYKVAVPYTVTVGTGTQEIRYLSRVAFDMPAADGAKYQIVNVDGSDWDNMKGGQTLDRNIDGKAGVYTLATGTYALLNKETGDQFNFNVVDPTPGVQQMIEMPNVETAGTVEELSALIQQATVQGNSLIINLEKDFNVNNAWSAPQMDGTGYSGCNTVVVNGNGHTISNMNQPLFAGFFGGFGSVTIKNLTIANSNIDFTATEVGGTLDAVGAFICYSDANAGINLDNCHLVDSTVAGAKYAGGLVGYASSSINITNCSVTGTTVTATPDNEGSCGAGAIIGQDAAEGTMNTVTVENCTIKAKYAGAIVGTSNAAASTYTNVSISGNTMNNTTQSATFDIEDCYGRFYEGLTINGTAATVEKTNN